MMKGINEQMLAHFYFITKTSCSCLTSGFSSATTTGAAGAISKLLNGNSSVGDASYDRSGIAGKGAGREVGTNADSPCYKNFLQVLLVTEIFK